MPGYKVTPVEAVKEGVICPHCHLILREAIQTTEEGHRLCESCYKEISSKPDRTCQECGISLGATEPVYPDRAVRRVILELLVKCDYLSNGCPWEGQLKHLEDHCRECRFQPLKCPNVSCTELLTPDWMDKHVDEECQYRRVKCEHCQEEEVAMKMEDHYKKCVKYPITCERCGSQVLRQELNEHQRSWCSVVECFCGELLRNCNSQLPTVELTDHQPRESTHEHLNDPLKVFNHIQNLANAIALMDSRLKEKEEALQSSQAEVKCLKIRVKQLEDELQEHSNIDARLAQLERRLGEMAAELKQSRSDRNSGNMMDYDQTTRIVMKQQIALLLQRRLQTSVDSSPSYQLSQPGNVISPEYETFHSWYECLVARTKHGINTLATQAFSRGLIPEEVYEKATNPQKEPSERARVLCDVIRSKIKFYPEALTKFLSMLKCDPSYNDIACDIETEVRNRRSQTSTNTTSHDDDDLHSYMNYVQIPVLPEMLINLRKPVECHPYPSGKKYSRPTSTTICPYSTHGYKSLTFSFLLYLYRHDRKTATHIPRYSASMIFNTQSRRCTLITFELTNESSLYLASYFPQYSEVFALGIINVMLPVFPGLEPSAQLLFFQCPMDLISLSELFS